MKKIGILTCTNTTQDMGCSSFACFEKAYEGSGEFERHNDAGGAQIAGIISCASCPTAVAPDKILRRVRTLTATGVEAIHLSSCMMTICPFKRKYAKLIREAFPHLEVVEGTHTPSPEEEKQVVGCMKAMLTQPQQTMADLVEAATKAQTAPAG